MKISYEDIVIRYNAVRTPADAVLGLLAAWKHSGRPELLRFGRAGGGIRPTRSLLEKHLQYGIVLTPTLILRSSRARSNVVVMESGFQDPAVVTDDGEPSNVCVFELWGSWVQDGLSGFRRADLTKLIVAASRLGEMRRGFVGVNAVRATKEYEVLNRRDRRGLLLHWIDYFRRDDVKSIGGIRLLEQCGLEILHEDKRGVVVTVNATPNDTELADVIVATTERLRERSRATRPIR
ncbi:MAG: hypothetical protein R3B13_37995 [Polyangiaceae bacterium]